MDVSRSRLLDYAPSSSAAARMHLTDARSSAKVAESLPAVSIETQSIDTRGPLPAAGAGTSGGAVVTTLLLLCSALLPDSRANLQSVLRPLPPPLSFLLIRHPFRLLDSMHVLIQSHAVPCSCCCSVCDSGSGGVADVHNIGGVTQPRHARRLRQHASTGVPTLTHWNCICIVCFAEQEYNTQGIWTGVMRYRNPQAPDCRGSRAGGGAVRPRRICWGSPVG
jgi:hypothetical protein